MLARVGRSSEKPHAHRDDIISTRFRRAARASVPLTRSSSNLYVEDKFGLERKIDSKMFVIYVKVHEIIK